MRNAALVQEHDSCRKIAHTEPHSVSQSGCRRPARHLEKAFLPGDRCPLKEVVVWFEVGISAEETGIERPRRCDLISRYVDLQSEAGRVGGGVPRRFANYATLNGVIEAICSPASSSARSSS